MDITTGSTAGRDALRAYLRAGATISDAEIQQCWDTAVDATVRWIRPGYVYSAPAGVQEFVKAVAAHVWRTRDSGGELQALPDGTLTGTTITSSLVRRYAILAGPYVTAPRVIV